MTLGTCGLTCDDWLQSADHQSSSENKSPAPQLSERLGARLMERLARYGSMEYSLTWKRRVTPAGRLYYQQRASARRISGRDCGGVQSGWLTPQAQVGPHGYRPAGPNGQLDLDRQVLVAGWCTPNAMDGGQTSRGGDRIGESLLAGQAQAAGWATPNAGLSTRSGYQDQEYTKARKEAGKQVDLMDEAQTLTTGAQPGSPAQTGPRGVLNPQFPLWLMGYPEAWATCAPGHQSWATVQKVLSETPDASARAYCEGPGTP